LWRERDVADGGARALADDLFDLDPHVLSGDAQRLQRLGGDALPLVEQAEQEVLGADAGVAQQPGFLLGEVDGPSGPVGEPAEHALWLRSHRCPLEPLGKRQGWASSHRLCRTFGGDRM
jgi:hypothetical protein